MMVSNDITFVHKGSLDLLRGKRLCMGVQIFEEETTRKDTCPIKREDSKVQTHKWGLQNKTTETCQRGCKNTTYDLNISLLA
jgi:hypothetical protein